MLWVQVSSAPKLRAACFQVLFTSIYHLKGQAIVPFAADLLNLSIGTIGGRYSIEVIIFSLFMNLQIPCLNYKIFNVTLTKQLHSWYFDLQCLNSSSNAFIYCRAPLLVERAPIQILFLFPDQKIFVLLLFC